MARRSAGVSGTAVLFGAAGIYLVYAGVRDVSLTEGLRSLLRGQRPTESAGQPYTGPPGNIVGIGAPGDAAPSPGQFQGGGGTLGLVGNAAAALPALKMLTPTLTFGGRAARPDNPSSDHPKGKAIDVMGPTASQAQRIIALFKSQPGAKYYIWNRKLGAVYRLWGEKSYTGSSPHTDHVHLSYY